LAAAGSNAANADDDSPGHATDGNNTVAVIGDIPYGDA